MTDSDLHKAIDETILSLTGKHWRKVAMIIAKTERALESKALSVDLEAIERCIGVLVEMGRLEGVGNLSNWRHSEVRLPPNA